MKKVSYKEYAKDLSKKEIKKVIYYRHIEYELYLLDITDGDRFIIHNPLKIWGNYCYKLKDDRHIIEDPNL